MILNRGPKGVGWEVVVPMPEGVGGTATVAGDTPEKALAAAKNRLEAAIAEFAKDPIRESFTSDVEIAGKSHALQITRRKSGKLHVASIEFDELRAEGRDEDKLVAEVGAKISARLARTIDSVPANVIAGNGKPKQTTFLRLDPVKLAADLALAEDDIAEKKADAAPYNKAVRNAEEHRDNLIKQLIAAGHEAQPEREREKAGAT